MSGEILGVIPARLGSSRLPRKPLLSLAGRPLVEWVWRRAAATGLFGRLVVATDSRKIAEVVVAFGGQAMLTDPDHPSGTDRVAEVAAREEYRGFDVVVNVQGDEPFVDAGHLAPAIDLVRGGSWEVGTAATQLRSLEEWRDPAAVKVVRAADGGALYFSRAPVPFLRDRDPSPHDLAGGAFLRHLGIYVYAADALARWVSLPEGALERVERREQLRPLAAGMRIGVAVVDPIPAGVDTPADAEAAELRLRAEASSPLNSDRDEPVR